MVRRNNGRFKSVTHGERLPPVPGFYFDLRMPLTKDRIVAKGNDDLRPISLPKQMDCLEVHMVVMIMGYQDRVDGR